MSSPVPSNFIRTIIEDDLRSGRVTRVVTRFPPEPNGYLHIGHAKAIAVSFGMAQAYDGACHLRMDDTNPVTEDQEFVDALKQDIRWLGFDWEDRFHHASDYFDQLYDWAVLLINKGLAYVDEQSEEAIRETRGTVDRHGTNSPWRERPATESVELLGRMKKGEFADGRMVLRAKIDMSHANMKMRDPLMYRIRNVPHYRTGDRWHIYPLYDWAHGQSDAIEGITHSFCSLEFDVNRELYDWFVDHLPIEKKPHQYEFARLNVGWTVLSKRRLKALVDEGIVDGWNDPRMPTIAGLRRRGFTPASIRNFVDGVGVAKANSMVNPLLLENAARDDLNDKAPRVMVVLDPLKVIIENFPDAGVEPLQASYWPHDIDKQGERAVRFTRELWIERSDFMETPTKGYHRLSPGAEVRLRYAYLVRCTSVDKDDQGNVVALRCTFDPESRGGTAPDGRRVKGTIHWVSAEDAIDVKLRQYDRLFVAEEPGANTDDWRQDLNPNSLVTVHAKAEASLATANGGQHYQFERTAFVYVDPDASVPGTPVFNQVVPLKDSWAKPSNTGVPAPRPKKRANKAAAPPPKPALSDAERALAATLESQGCSGDEAIVLATHPDLRAHYDASLAQRPQLRTLGSWYVNDVRAVFKDGLPSGFSTEQLAELAALVEDGTINRAIAKKVFATWLETGRPPRTIVDEDGLLPIRDRETLMALVQSTLADATDKVDAFKKGRTGLFGFFVGQVMKRSGGRADPERTKALLEEVLN